ncbi:hypothetical protein [Haloarchaeobius iranensis]|uniref:Uncharacterized protein n=1 Tax=Haloarchaeobius iranensis TaxID=996166 RepID=A0A1G9YXP2_9EURY|nr:hypothetical protein [Haloarchaeobius iranensis]SDN13465.1 hypothetical protein SAMN05192554_11678 [Haloarchaeobius iranensis]
MRAAATWLVRDERAVMTLGERVVAVAAIAFINAAFAMLVPWMAVFALVASLPLLAVVVLR